MESNRTGIITAASSRHVGLTPPQRSVDLEACGLPTRIVSGAPFKVATTHLMMACVNCKALGSESTDGGGEGRKKGKGHVTTRSDLCVEYAKSSRSSCKGCNSTIEKGEVRVAKMEPPDPTERAFAGLIPRWHHVTCFLERAAELEAEGVLAEELSGFSKLKKEDQKELKTSFPGPGKKKGGK